MCVSHGSTELRHRADSMPSSLCSCFGFFFSLCTFEMLCRNAFKLFLLRTKASRRQSSYLRVSPSQTQPDGKPAARRNVRTMSELLGQPGALLRHGTGPWASCCFWKVQICRDEELAD